MLWRFLRALVLVLCVGLLAGRRRACRSPAPAARRCCERGQRRAAGRPQPATGSTRPAPDASTRSKRRAPRLPWRCARPDQQHRLDGKALWIRFDADGAGERALVPRSRLLRHRPRAAVLPRPRRPWVVQEAGDSRPVSQWPVPGRVPTFALARRPATPVRYWVRIEHERVDFAAPTHAVPPEQRCWPARARAVPARRLLRRWRP